MTVEMMQTYRKDLKHSPGHGYGRDIGDSVPVWVADRGRVLNKAVIHTTNNDEKGTKFENEATYLRDSPIVSCHALIGKDGRIAEILPPEKLAWHTGATIAGFSNFWAYGIELHVSLGEVPTVKQIASLTMLMLDLIQRFGIKEKGVDTHRAVAVPKGRKPDPEGWSNEDFYGWRAQLYAPIAEPVQPDYPALWGDAAPYRADFGIPALWREHYQQLGAAVSDELPVDGGLVQVFRGGLVRWPSKEVKAW